MSARAVENWLTDDTHPFPVIGTTLAVLWPLPVLFYWLFDHFARRRRRVVYSGEVPWGDGSFNVADIDKESLTAVERCTVMLGSLEHSLPHLPNAQAVAGGLGKVVDLIARHHPTDIFMVHPMVAQDEKVDYGQPDQEDPPLRIIVDGVRENVRVLRHVFLPHGRNGPNVVFLMLSHSRFEVRTRNTIYPNPMTRRNVLGFFSLWNQAVGALIARHKPDIFHLPDFHTAVAPWYALPKWPRLKLLLVLHNAEYQGSISTDMMQGEKLQVIADIWNLPVELVERHLVLDGRFNMLKAAVNFVVEQQDGIGVCAVSQHYAVECLQTYSVLWNLPGIDGLDNPMLEEERANLTDTLAATKAAAKHEIQELFGLKVDPGARIFVSLGRLVRQKGVDLLADIAPWILKNYPTAQLVIVGPIGDGFGHYASQKLTALAVREEVKGRVFIRCEFMRVPESLKFAADFCLMPSRAEPFGYVDIEFAWRGALVVGAQAGGLGKVPGFYYIAQNQENLARLRRELQTAVGQAMRAPPDQIQSMSSEALRCEFPLEVWHKRLMTLYKDILLDVEPHGGDMEMTAMDRLCPKKIEVCSEDDRSIIVSNRSTRQTTENVGTFTPYGQADADRTTVMPVSMINVQVQGKQVEADMSASWTSDNEFLTQELAEAELSLRVSAKVEQDPNLNIDEVLEGIGSEVDLEREEDPVARWLLTKKLKVHHVHWLVSIGYIVSGIAQFLAFVTATEWGLRGGAHFPEWFMDFPWFQRVFGHGGVDPPLLSIVLYSTNACAFIIGAPIWAGLTKRFEPRQLLAMSLLCQVPLIFMIGPMNPTIAMALTLIFTHGLTASAALLFVVFNFMMSIKGDMSETALRMGRIELTRHVVSWLVAGYIFFASPSSIQGSKRESLPVEVTLFLLPLALVVGFLTLASGVLLVRAPGPYRDDRMPGWDLGLLWKRKSFLILGLSDCVGALGSFPSTCYVTWWLGNGWTSAELGYLTFLFGIVLGVGTLVWAKVLALSSRHGLSFLIGTVLLTAPPALLRSVVQSEVSSFTHLGRSNAAMVICVYTLLMEGVRSSAMWIAKIRIINSRWRLLSYGTISMVCRQFCSMLSPWACEYLARKYSSTFITRNQKELSDAVIVCVGPLCVAQFVLQVCAAPFIHLDLGVADDSDRAASDMVALLPRIQRRGPLILVVLTSLVVGIAVFYTESLFISRPLPFDAVRRCHGSVLPKTVRLGCREIDIRENFVDPAESRYDAQEKTACGRALLCPDGKTLNIGSQGLDYDTMLPSKVLSVCGQTCDLNPQCAGFAYSIREGRCFYRRATNCGREPDSDMTCYTKTGHLTFGLNKYGQNTTGRQHCLHRMRTMGGNTFVFWERGRCQVLDCDPNAMARMHEENAFEPWGQEAEVWSRHCDMSGQNLVIVHLFEWRWDDVALECEEYLGPAGYNVVQVSPPAEHAAGDSWSARYMPVSYKLETRSGNRSEFIRMVSRCVAAGVHVMVDAVINHMAAPTIQNPKRDRGKECGAPTNSTKSSTVKCRGWTGGEYGNRFFNNEPFVDKYSRSHFHHYPNNPHSNCGLPPWTNNRHLCDLYGLPDLDVEQRGVQRMVQGFLADLYHIGVTMLRIDAAMLMYPETIARILQPFPWQYMVQEFYPAVLQHEQGTLAKATTISSLTDFQYGHRIAQSVFDTYDTDTDTWNDKSETFGELLQMSERSVPSCKYGYCDSPVPARRALLFLDNHDQQRERWTPAHFPKPKTPICSWDGKSIASCRPIYKHGQTYNMLMNYMLGWPYGDACRIMSSYGWTVYDSGPPGVGIDMPYARPTRVIPSQGCRETPDVSPVSGNYDDADNPAKWVCEHRWEGVAGMTRFRRLIGKKEPVHMLFDDKKGHIAFSLGQAGFVAVHRGYNRLTKHGPKKPWNLAEEAISSVTEHDQIFQGVPTGLQAGEYCDVARGTKPLVGPQQWKGTCPEDQAVLIGKDGVVARGTVRAGHVLALHILYRRAAGSGLAEETFATLEV